MNAGSSSGNGVWKWIAGILAAVLLSWIGGTYTGAYFSEQSDELLLKQARAERVEYVNDYVEKRLIPRFEKLEREIRGLESGQAAILEELRRLK